MPESVQHLLFFYVTCVDDVGANTMPSINLTLTPGVTYYIRLWDFFDATSGNIGGICVTDPNPPLATTGAVGIGIQNPDNLLDVNGVIKIRGGNPGLNKILTSDINGAASWVAPVIFDAIPFKGTNSTALSIPSGPSTNINFNVEEYDVGGNFSSGTFTVPASGVYHFDATVYWSLSGITSTTFLSLSINVLGSTVHSVSNTVFSGGSVSYTQTISADLALTASQTVQISVAQTSGITQTITCNTGFGKFSYFNGHRIN